MPFVGEVSFLPVNERIGWIVRGRVVGLDRVEIADRECEREVVKGVQTLQARC